MVVSGGLAKHFVSFCPTPRTERAIARNPPHQVPIYIMDAMADDLVAIASSELVQALARSDVVAVREALATPGVKPNLDMEPYGGQGTPLSWVIGFGDLPCALALIEAGALVELKGKVSQHVRRLSDEGHTAILEAFLEAGVSGEGSAKSESEPLCMDWAPILSASVRRHPDCLALLVKAGVNLDVYYSKGAQRGKQTGRSALWYALRDGNPATTSLLLSAGAKCTFQPSAGNPVTLLLLSRAPSTQATLAALAAHTSREDFLRMLNTQEALLTPPPVQSPPLAPHWALLRQAVRGELPPALAWKYIRHGRHGHPPPDSKRHKDMAAMVRHTRDMMDFAGLRVDSAEACRTLSEVAYIDDTDGLAQALIDIGVDPVQAQPLQDLSLVGAVPHKPPLHFAAAENNLPLMQTLRAAGVPLDLVGPQGETALWWAARHGSMECLEYLLSCLGRDLSYVNAVTHDGVSALMAASTMGETACVQQLLKHGADPHIGNKAGDVPLVVAARNNHVGVLEALLEGGASVRAVDRRGRCALLNLTPHGMVSGIALLLNHGADPNAAERDGETALMRLHRGDVLGTAKLLLAAGADATARNRDGENALMLCTVRGSLNVSTLALIGVLLDAGCKLTDTSATGRTVFDCLRAGDEDVAAALLQADSARCQHRKYPLDFIRHITMLLELGEERSRSFIETWADSEGHAVCRTCPPLIWSECALLQLAIMPLPRVDSLLSDSGSAVYAFPNARLGNCNTLAMHFIETHVQGSSNRPVRKVLNRTWGGPVDFSATDASGSTMLERARTWPVWALAPSEEASIPAYVCLEALAKCPPPPPDANGNTLMSALLRSKTSREDLEQLVGSFESHGVELDTSDTHRVGPTPLGQAATIGDLDWMIRLLQAGVSVNQTFGPGVQSPLLAAGNEGKMEAFLRALQRTGRTGELDFTAILHHRKIHAPVLVHAARRWNAEWFDALLEAAPRHALDLPCSRGYPPTWHACRAARHQRPLVSLLAAGASLPPVLRWKAQPLFKCGAWRGRQSRAVVTLVSGGVIEDHAYLSDLGMEQWRDLVFSTLARHEVNVAAHARGLGVPGLPACDAPLPQAGDKGARLRLESPAALCQPWDSMRVWGEVQEDDAEPEVLRRTFFQRLPNMHAAQLLHELGADAFAGPYQASAACRNALALMLYRNHSESVVPARVRNLARKIEKDARWKAVLLRQVVRK